MKKIVFGISISLCCVFFWACKPNRSFKNEEIAIIPQVEKMTLGESSFKFKSNTKLVVESVDQELIARQFANQLEKVSGMNLQIIVGGNEGSNQVYFKTEIMKDPEAYSIDVQNNRIEIKAAKPAGFFYAIQTIKQLLPAEFERDTIVSEKEWLVPAISIQDGPQFKWRGYMLDVSRHFFPKEDVLKMIDYLAFHKINTLHFHLVDDQGWRIEIKKYPKLTTIGAWRVDYEDLNWDLRPKQVAGEKATYGGFYTQDDIREIVAYAQKNFITVVPEIEMPAHASAALAAYPQFSCTGGPFTVPTGGVWPITDIYCAGNDSSFLFLQDVLTEVMDLFPSKYIHIGADEATKTEWEKCPKCRKRIQGEGLKNVGELQSYFVTRIEKFINSKDRILLGWDEILEGGLPPKATVMSWRGIQGGIEAAKQGHDVVMTPTSDCYFDYYQGSSDLEPPAIGGYLPLRDVYSFNPVPAELDAQSAKHIIGGQANLWTEYIPNLKHAEYMTFPRLAAMSEVLWSPAELRNWEDFYRRLQFLMIRYDELGINYSKSAYNVTGKLRFRPEDKKIEIVLRNELPGSDINYSTDGSEPTNLSTRYTEPLLIEKSSTVKAIAITGGVASKSKWERTLSINKATGTQVKYLKTASLSPDMSGINTLVNGIRGSKDVEDGQWQGWKGIPMDVVVRLGESTKISKVSIGTMNSPGTLLFCPAKVEYYVSNDGVGFRKVGEILNDTDPLSKGIQIKDFSISFDTIPANFVKVVASNIGKCPNGHRAEGYPAWIAIDEIAIE